MLHVRNIIRRFCYHITTVLLTEGVNVMSGNFDKEVLVLIAKGVGIFIQEDMGVEVVEVSDTTFYISRYQPPRFYTAIGIKGDFNSVIVFNFETSLIKKLSAVLVPEGFSREETLEMIADVPAEVANITLGLALQDFPEAIDDVSITPPFKLDDALIKEIKDSKLLSIKIRTVAGDILCSMIKR